MGKRFTVFDDLDDTLDADRTVTFSLENVAYEIDLAGTNITALEAALAPYMAAGRKVGKAVPVKGSSSKKTANPELDAIRRWASKNGYRVSDKGRIPRHVIEAHDAANPTPAASKEPAKAAAKAAAAKAPEPAFSAASK